MFTFPISFCDFQRNHGILLGVVGTDVPVSELLKTIPKYKVLDAIIIFQNPQDNYRLFMDLDAVVGIAK